MNMILSPAQELIYIKDMSNIIDFKSINTEFNNLEFVKNQYNEIANGLKFFDNTIFQNTKKLLELECTTYLNECYSIKDMYDNISITSSWGNITKPKQYHHEHSHPLSVVSGIIYLDNNIDNLNLNFVLQNRGAIIPYFVEQDKEARMSLKTILEMFGHNPITHNNLKNHLILFLSNLKHYVTPTPINSIPRKSISFNTFWKGMIGKKDNPLGSLSFDQVSVIPKHKI
jgi:uncharacterized protein (TIGR02466 family)